MYWAIISSGYIYLFILRILKIIYWYLSVGESSGCTAAETQHWKSTKPPYKNKLQKKKPTQTVKEREILTKFVQGLWCNLDWPYLDPQLMRHKGGHSWGGEYWWGWVSQRRPVKVILHGTHPWAPNIQVQGHLPTSKTCMRNPEDGTPCNRERFLKRTSFLISLCSGSSFQPFY